MKKTQIRRLLPAVMQRTATPEGPLLATLDIMQTMHDSPEETLDNLDGYFDPRRTPDRFVPYLAGWVDLRVLLEISRAGASSTAVTLSTGLGRLRELTASAAKLSEWRGTRKGLQLFLQIATGITGFEIEEQVLCTDGSTRPFHIRIKGPAAALPHRPLVEKIIELEKPAYVTYELEFYT